MVSEVHRVVSGDLSPKHCLPRHKNGLQVRTVRNCWAPGTPVSPALQKLECLFALGYGPKAEEKQAVASFEATAMRSVSQESKIQ